jgi:hypothetical protein
LSPSFLFCRFRVCLCGAALMDFCLLVVGARAPRLRQVRRPRPDER